MEGCAETERGRERKQSDEGEAWSVTNRALDVVIFTASLCVLALTFIYPGKAY